MLQVTAFLFPVVSQTPSTHSGVRSRSYRAKLQLPHCITTHTSASASHERDAPLIRQLPQCIRSLTCITSPSVWFPNWRRSVYYTNVSHTRTPTFTRRNQDQLCHTHQTKKNAAHAQYPLNAIFHIRPKYSNSQKEEDVAVVIGQQFMWLIFAR